MIYLSKHMQHVRFLNYCLTYRTHKDEDEGEVKGKNLIYYIKVCFEFFF